MGDNVFDKFDPPAAPNPFDQFDEPRRGPIAEIATAAKRGLYEGVRGAGAVLQAPAEMAGEEPGIISRFGQKLEAFGKQGAEANKAEPGHSGATEFLSEAAAAPGAALPLLATTIPAAAGGAALGTMVAPGPGTLAGAVGGALASGAAGGGTVALQTYHEKYHEGLERGLSDADAREYAKKSALLQGASMGAVSAIPFAGPAARTVMGSAGRTAAEATADVAGKRFLPEFAKSAGEIAAVNTGLGVTGAAGQAAIDEGAGLETPTPLEAAQRAILPSVAGAVGFLPLGAYSAFRTAAESAKIRKALTDPETPTTERLRAALQVHASIDKADPAAAAEWDQAAAAAIHEGNPVALDGSYAKREPAASPAPGEIIPQVTPEEEPPPQSVVDPTRGPLSQAAALSEHGTLPAFPFASPEAAQASLQGRGEPPEGWQFAVERHPSVVNRWAVTLKEIEKEASDARPVEDHPGPDGGGALGEAAAAADHGEGARASQAAPEAPHLDTLAHEAATSPLNDRSEPTPAQQEAGNYKKGHMEVHGLDISVENPAGSIRKGADWEQVMQDHYGYIKGTVGRDKDHVDVFVGPNPESTRAFVVDQVNPKTGRFDEHKVVLGANSLEEARALYKRNYAEGWSGAKTIRPTDIAGLKRWLKEGDMSKPFAEHLEQPEAQHPVDLKRLERVHDMVKEPEAKDALAAAHVLIRAGKWDDAKAALEAASNALFKRYPDLARVVDDLVEKGWPEKKAKPKSPGELAAEEAARAQPDIKGNRPNDAGVYKPTEALRLPGRQPQGVAQAEINLAHLADGTWTYGSGHNFGNEGSGFAPSISSKTFGSREEALADAAAKMRERAMVQVKKEGTAEAKDAHKILKWLDEVAPRGGGEEPPKEPDRFAKNTVFTSDKVAAARERMKKKLGNLNAGIDPELMADGMTIAGAHIEAGLRDFASYAKAMVEDFGDAIKPYLLSFYEAARHYPGIEKEGMSSAADAERLHTELTAKAPVEPLAKPQSGAENEPHERVAEQPGRAADTGTVQRPGQSPERGGPEPGGPDAGGNLGNRVAEAGEGARHVESAYPSGHELPARPGKGGERAAGPSASSDARSARDGRPPAQTAGNTATGNFEITGELDRSAFAPKSLFRSNVEAIRLLKQLEEQRRGATPDEQSILASYIGWGGLKQAFDPANKDWAREHAQLKELLSPEEFAAANRSILDAHYTSRTVADGVWTALQRLGFEGGRVLEPSMGTGNFFGLMPAALRAGSNLHGVELDRVTGGIAKLLYPKATVHAPKGFHEVKFSPESFDLAIGNPPFGDQSVFDANHKAISKFKIHAYFFAKALDTVRPGGLLGMVVSKGLLDAGDANGIAARKHLAERAELVGAIRLPNTAFKTNANTEVTTDLIFLRKLAPGEKGNPEAWVDLGSVKSGEHDIPVNKYFAEHPDMMLGDMGLTGTMYRANTPTLEAREGQNLPVDLAQAIAKLPRNVMRDHEDVMLAGERAKHEKAFEAAAELKPYNYFVEGGKLFLKHPDHDGEAVVQPQAHTGAALERMKGLVEIRAAARGLINAEAREETTDAQLKILRGRLNKVYDAYVKKNGFLNQDTNKRAFREDADATLLLALEKNFDKGVSLEVARKAGQEARRPAATKADIFSKRTINPVKMVTEAASAKDAMFASLNERGKVDPVYMARLYKKSTGEVLKELGDLVYHDPDAGYVTRDAYLSGNVKEKLARALTEAARDPEGYGRNVEALEKVQPPDKKAADIFVQLGSTWIPEQHYKDFVRETIEGDMQGMFAAAIGKFVGLNIRSTNDALNKAKYGTQRASAGFILEHLLGNKPPIVYDSIKVGDSEKRVVNQEETAAAQGKAEELQAAFQDWIWKTPERREGLGRIYNDRFNTHVKRVFDGSHMTFPGMNRNIDFRPHQSAMVYRALQDRNLLANHVVGAGKTFAFASTAMELRRLGLAKKPMITVPNHLVLEWAKQFKLLYPGANLLAATRKDFEKSNRKQLFSKIATGDWDAVVVAHSSFGFIPVPREMEVRLLEDQKADIVEAIEAAKREQGKRFSARDLEKAKERIEAKLARIAERKQDDIMDFAQMGVDALMVDEAQEFKNLFYTTSMTGVSGLGDPSGSTKAFDMFVKTQYVQEQNAGKNIFFATGTPVANTIAEVFHMQRYLQMADLKARAIHQFDAWANTFGRAVTDWVMDAAGRFKQKTRFSEFQNLKELKQLWNAVTDTVTRNDLIEDAKKLGKVFPLPKVKGGKPNNIVAERSQRQAEYIGIPQPVLDEHGQQVINKETGVPEVKYAEGTIIDRLDNWPSRVKQNPREMPLVITGDARKAGLDFRLIDANAPDFPASKVNRAVAEIHRIWQANDYRKGTQLVFIDLSTPKSAKGKATAEAAARTPTFFIREGGVDLKHVQGVKTTLAAAPEDSFFSYQDDRKRYVIVDAVSGLRVGQGRTKQEAVDEANSRVGSIGVDRFRAKSKESAIDPADINDYVARWEEERAQKEPERAEGEEQEVSIDDLLADQGTSDFSVYDDIRQKLQARGIPPEQIAFIHEYETDLQKEALFERVNNGAVRVLLGSTKKMGAGTNVQRKLVAKHDLDSPWRPADLEQRDGRIIRQGNEFYEADPDGFEVEMHRYATERTYDARMWEIIEQKARSIEAFHSKDDIDTIEDVSSESANAAEMKAGASGDPRILESIQLNAEVKKLQAQERSWKRSRYDLEESIARTQKKQGYPWASLERFEAVKDLADAKTETTQIEFDGKRYAADKPPLEFTDHWVRTVKAMIEANMKPQVLGHYRGFDLIGESDLGNPRFSLASKGFEIGSTSYLKDDKFSGSGFIQRLDDQIRKIPTRITDLEAHATQRAHEAEQAQAELAKDFPKAAELAEKRDRQRALIQELRASVAKKAEPAAEPPAEGEAKFSRGEPETKEFKAWFGDSKVVDKRGDPLVVYHGTAGDHNEFHVVQRGRFFDNPVSKEGFFFTPEKTIATLFSDHAVGANRFEERGRVIAAYLSLQNPVEIDGKQYNGRHDGTEDLAAAIQRAKAAGHDGAVIRGWQDGSGARVQYVAFNSEQIKSVDNRGTFDVGNPDIRFSREAPVFYSDLARKIEALPQKAGDAAQWKGVIANLKGVKADEIEWSGIDDWLDTRDGKVTKAEVQQFLEQNGVKVDEVMLGGEGSATAGMDRAIVELDAKGYDVEWTNDTNTGERVISGVIERGTGERLDFIPGSGFESPRGLDIPNSVRDIGEEIAGLEENMGTSEYAPEGETKFGLYTLPGGKNYRELLLTLPGEEFDPAKVAFKRIRQSATQGSIEVAYDGKPLGTWKDEIKVQGREWRGRSDAQIIDLVRARFNGSPENRIAPLHGGFRSSHFDQPNILAHVRFDERTDAEGKKVLFIEEIQSDWAQKGKREGFAKDTSGWTAQQLRSDQDGGFNHWQVNDANGNEVTKIVGARDAESAIRKAAEGIPSAPFVGKTEAWVALSVKRMIRYAIDNGFDRVAYTTGEQQVERYELSKHIRELHVGREEDGTYSIGAHTTNGVRDIGYRISEKELPEYVGKDMADKIIANPADRQDYSGLDLKIGGEGMKAFYDKIIPNVVNDVLKKLGGGRVGEVRISEPYTEAEKAGRGNATAEYPTVQPGFDITPEMRAQVQGGVPLFSREAPAGEGRVDVAAVTKRLGVQAKIVATEEELPEHLRAQIAREKAAGEIRGVYDPKSGEVWLVGNNIRSEGQAAFVALHEAAHRGLAKIFGEDLHPVLEQIFRSNARVQEQARALMLKYKYDQTRATEEVLADMALRGQARNLKGWERFVAFLRDWLVKRGFNLKVSDEMAEHIAGAAAKAGRELEVAGEDVKFSRAAEGPALFGVAAKLKEGLSDEVKQREIARGGFRAALANLERNIGTTDAALEKARQAIDAVPVPERWQAMYEYQTGGAKAVADPKLRPIFEAWKANVDERARKIQDWDEGYLKEVLPNYFSQMWKDPDKALEWYQRMMGKGPLEGGKSFLKKRAYATYREGMSWKVFDDQGGARYFATERDARNAAGVNDVVKPPLEPVSQNFIDIAQLSLQQMDKFIAMHEFRQWLKEEKGWVKLVRRGETPPAGYAKVDDPAFRSMAVFPVTDPETGKLGAAAIHNDYMVPALIARDLNNYLDKGLYRFGLWRNFRYAQNLMLSARLGFSAFHAGFTTMDTLVSHADVGARYLLQGNVAKALQTWGKAITSPITAPIEGRKLLRQFYGQATADLNTRAVLDFITEGGARGRMNATDFNNSWSSVKRAWADGRIKDTAFHLLPGIMEGVMRPIMHHLVPWQKMTARVLLAKFELDRVAASLGKAPGEYARIVSALGEDAKRQIAYRVVQQVDDRLGQVAYDNLFWNRFAKDIAQASIQSVGWNVGTANVILGGAKDTMRLLKPEQLLAPLDRAGKVTNMDLGRVTGRLSYLISLNLTVGMMGAALNYLLTGQQAQDLRDYFFPRTGRKNPDGSDERISMPSYIKDEYALSQHPITTVQHKLHPFFSMVAELLKNEDFYGTQIVNKDDPWTKIAGQVVSYLGKSVQPYAVQNLRQNRDKGETGPMSAAPFIGITPAPASVSRTPFEAYVAERYAQAFHQTLTPEGAEKAKARRDAIAALKAGKTPDLELFSPHERMAIFTASRTPVQQQRFARLSIQEKLSAWERATPAERAQYNLKGLLVRDFSTHQLGMDPDVRQKVLEILRTQ